MRVKELLPNPTINYNFLGPAYPGAAVLSPAFGTAPGTVYNPQGNLTYANFNGCPASTNLTGGSNWGGNGATTALSGVAGPYSTNMVLVTSTTTNNGQGFIQSNPGGGSLIQGPYLALTWHVKRGNQPWAGIKHDGLGYLQWCFYNFDTDTTYANGAFSFTRTVLANGIVRLTMIIQTYPSNAILGYKQACGPHAGPSGSGTVAVGDTVYCSDPQVEMTLDPANYVTNFNYLPNAGAGAFLNCRFDYDPVALTPRGWLIEEARTNSLRNGASVGAVAGTPGTLPTNWSVLTAGGLTTNVITGNSPTGQVPYENGIPYVDIQVTGTTTGTSYQLVFDAANIIGASNGQTWTHSAFLKLAGGSFANVTQLQLQTASYSGTPTLLTTYNTNVANPTNAALNRQRVSGSLTIADATTAFVRPGIGFTCSIGVAINFTIRIGCAQVEQGAFASSPSPTWTGNYQHGPDQANFATLAFWNASQGTIACQFMPEVVTAAQQYSYFIDNGIGGQVYTSIKSGNVTLTATVSSTPHDMVGPAAVAGTLYKSALGYAANNIRGAVNGAYTGAAIAFTLATLNGGAFLGPGGTGFLNGWLQGWSYYNTRLTDSQLLIIST